MAKCPVCGKIWWCKNENESLYYDIDDDEEKEEEELHCRTCRCKECRDAGIPIPKIR